MEPFLVVDVVHRWAVFVRNRAGENVASVRGDGFSRRGQRTRQAFPRKQRACRPDAISRLEGQPARSAGLLAPEPQDRRPHHADLAPADLDRLGTGADLPLQRPLQIDHRRQASLGAGPPDVRRVARDLERHRADAGHGDEGPRRHLCRGAAPDHGAQRRRLITLSPTVRSRPTTARPAASSAPTPTIPSG